MPLWSVETPEIAPDSIGNFTPVEVLFEFDCLSTFVCRASDGGLLLAHLCDIEDGERRFLVVPTTSQIVRSVKGGKRDLRSALQQARAYFVDLASDGHALRAYSTAFEDVPADCLPESEPPATQPTEHRAARGALELRDAETRADQEDSYQLATWATSSVFITGGGVRGSLGIRPRLAGEALVHFEKMYSEQVKADELVAVREVGRQRRSPNTPEPVLLFTNILRGSFGLEFTPAVPAEEGLRETHISALARVTDSLVLIASPDPSEVAVEGIPPAVLHPMKMFVRALVRNGAELRLADATGREREIKTPQLAVALDRLDRQVKDDDVQITATLRGVTLQTGHFDLLTEEGDLITGVVGSEIPEHSLRQFHELTNKRCDVILRKRTIIYHSRPSDVEYFLLKATEAAAPAGGSPATTK